jgi:radical SAM protein with 4Fe4S-binding SPASM domain
MQDDEIIKNPPFIPLLQFETSTRCNGRCVFCGHKDMKRHGDAKWETLIEVMDTCVPHAWETAPYMYGEPFMEPRILDILDNVKQINPHTKTILYSNMNTITRTQATDLIKSQLLDELSTSFYGPTPQLYKKYQPTFSWKRTRNNIRMFMQIRQKLGLPKPQVCMHYIALPDLLPFYLQYSEEWGKIVDEVGLVIYRTLGGHDSIVPNVAEFSRATWGPTTTPKRVPCSRPWKGFYVLFNGDIVPCCSDIHGEYVMGNILEQEWRDIWWGDKFKQWRRNHIDGKYASYCVNCNYWEHELPKEWYEYWLKQPVICGTTN